MQDSNRSVQAHSLSNVDDGAALPVHFHSDSSQASSTITTFGLNSLRPPPHNIPQRDHGRVGNWTLCDLVDPAPTATSPVRILPAPYNQESLLLDFGNLSSLLRSLPAIHTLRTGLLNPSEWADAFEGINLALDPTNDVLPRATIHHVIDWHERIDDCSSGDSYLAEVHRAAVALTRLDRYLQMSHNLVGCEEALTRLQTMVDTTDRHARARADLCKSF